MDSIARQHQWQAILQMTEQLQQLSVDESWQAMNELGARRQAGLEDFFAVPVSLKEAEEVAAGIQQILQSDQRLINRGRAHQAEMSDAVKKISGTRQAIRAYTHIHTTPT
ncbi:hypothetical protein MNBD_GAMMA11-2145 [hydrothermal vent metagenome]|uniref:Flagellar protein FliT n=1 Tax=hydrothermal vent metagenome TaxID=652676 RepID=A0A3B0XH77_9ZZZZ